MRCRSGGTRPKRSDRSAYELADVWSVLIGPPLDYQLVLVAGWSPDRYAEWLADTMSRLLLVPPPSDAQRPKRER